MQECVGSVRREAGRCGLHWVGRRSRLALVVYGEIGKEGLLRNGGGVSTIFMVPSHDEEQNVSLDTRFQCTENTSRLCSCHD